VHGDNRHVSTQLATVPYTSACRLKIADFSAELGQYSKAVELYEEAAKRAVENNLLKFSARGYLLNAGEGQDCAHWSNLNLSTMDGRHDTDGTYLYGVAGICGLCYLKPDDIEAKIER
jgi:hypothetical protein